MMGGLDLGSGFEVVDLTRVFEEGMPVYPGTEGPRISNATTIAREGFAEKLLTVYSHTGTHMDAPAHMIEGAPTLDALPASTFLGKARVLDISSFAGGEAPLPALAPILPGPGEAEFILFRTGWSAHWGDAGYYEGFPVLSAELAQAVAALGLKGIGVDAISVDPVGSTAFERHLALLGRGLVIVENLGDLSTLAGRDFLFSCLPLRIRDADGSPVRAVAMVR